MTEAMLEPRQMKVPGPPYFSYQIALPGGRPTVKVDIPICAVLLALYIIGAIMHQVTFQRNKKRGHKFLMSWAMFGFSMARVGTMVLRIAWTTRPNNARLAIAANIFVNIGVLVVYVVLLLMAMRIFRATHPRLGWNRSFRQSSRVAYVLLGMALLLTVAFTVLMFYTLNPKLRTAALWIQRAASLYILIFNLVTDVLVILSAVLPQAEDAEDFGTGSIRSKLLVLGFSCFFSTFIAGFRMGLSWSPSHTAAKSPWYDGKSAFYVIEFGFEVVILFFLFIVRFDQMFWVPNGSGKVETYIDKAAEVEDDEMTTRNDSVITLEQMTQMTGAAR